MHRDKSEDNRQQGGCCNYKPETEPEATPNFLPSTAAFGISPLSIRFVADQIHLLNDYMCQNHVSRHRIPSPCQVHLSACPLRNEPTSLCFGEHDGEQSVPNESALIRPRHF